MSPSPLDEKSLFIEIKQLIQSARQRAAVSVNSELTLLYWQVGKRISDEVLKGERAEYNIKGRWNFTCAGRQGMNRNRVRIHPWELSCVQEKNRNRLNCLNSEAPEFMLPNT